MSDKVMSRRKFLVGTGAVLGAAGLSGLVLAERPSPARGAGVPTPIPWPYPTDPAKQPDPVKMAGRAFEIFYNAGCAEGAWYPVIEFLAADYADTWGTLPANVFQYAAGGVGSWGTLCGALNGAAALIGMVGAPGEITDEVFAWYAKTPIPSNGAERAVEAGTWTPSGAPQPMSNMPTSIAHSQLCHASLSQWTMTSGFDLGTDEHYDRCGKLTFDVEVKTITLLNAYFQDNNNVPVVALDPTVAACKTCHESKALGKQACDSCHDQTTTHAQ